MISRVFLRMTVLSVCGLLLSGGLIPGACYGASITVNARVEEPMYLFGNDGEIYVMTENTVSKEIVENHMGEMLRVRGDVDYSEEEDMMILTPEQYEPITSGEEELPPRSPLK